MTVEQVEIVIDVSDAAGLDVPASVGATVALPDPALLPDRPVVCLARPSSSYARGYYTCDLPGAGSGAQAGFHAAQGWIFVALDTLGCTGDPTIDPEDLTFRLLAATGHAAEREILLRLANGVLLAGYPPVNQPVKVGIGHSLGGALAIYQQAHHRSYDGLAVLGFGAVRSHPPVPPGAPEVVTAWYARDAALEDCREPLNARAVARAEGQPDAAWEALAWGFHHDDVPPDVVEQDLAHYEAIARERGQRDDSPPWYAARTPTRAARSTLTPGIVASEAAAVDVPVLVATGERDLVPDPAGEPRAYLSSPGVDVFNCPRMGHVHNMAGTRRLLWERIHAFGEWCAKVKATG